MKALFDRVIELCDTYKISPRDLEQQCGLSRHAIDKWQNGSAFIESIFKVSDYFDVSIDYLTGKTDNPKSHKQPIMLANENENFIYTLKKLTFTAEDMMQCLNSFRPYLSGKTDGESKTIK